MADAATRARHLCDFLVAAHTILKERTCILPRSSAIGAASRARVHGETPEVEHCVKKTPAVEPCWRLEVESGGHRGHGRHARRTGGEVRVSGGRTARHPSGRTVASDVAAVESANYS